MFYILIVILFGISYRRRVKGKHNVIFVSDRIQLIGDMNLTQGRKMFWQTKIENLRIDMHNSLHKGKGSTNMKITLTALAALLPSSIHHIHAYVSSSQVQ
jgi:hypothetical protein